jgi:predicted N-acetyltransferase YhbS
VLTSRLATPGDVAEVRAIVEAAFEIYIPRIGRPPAPMTVDYATAVDRHEVWVVLDEGEIAGLALLVAQPDHLLLDVLAVRPGAQGRGIGAYLLRLAEGEATALGFAEIRLCTNAAMTENLRYYPRHGYQLTHRAQQDHFQRVFFTKQLHDPTLHV